MGIYNKTIITNAGINAIAQAIAESQTLAFKTAKTSSYAIPDGTNIRALTSLRDIVQSVELPTPSVYNSNTVQVYARFSNTNIETEYYINTIGVYASLAGGAEFLFAVLTAITPDKQPVFNENSPTAFIYNIMMRISDAANVVFAVNDTGTATVADLNRLAQPFTGCTKTANGTSGMVPQPFANFQNRFLSGAALWEEPAAMIENFRSSDVSDSDSVTEWTAVDKLATGENHNTIMGKISKMFKNIRYLRKNGIKNITRNGTTFTATRLDGSTFTFDQQDNNTTYGLSTTSAAGLLRQLNGNTSQYMRGDGTWQTPPNTWRGIQNNLTSTSTTDSLSAAQGKILNDTKQKNIIIATKLENITVASKTTREYTFTPTVLGISGSVVILATMVHVAGAAYNNYFVNSDVYLNGTGVKVYLYNDTGASANIPVRVVVQYYKQ